MSSEYHLFIIWEKASEQKERIINDLQSKFVIINVYEVQWASDQFSSNLSRFYGTHLPVGCHKQKHCGEGPFTLIIVKDTHPEYADRLTSKGIAKVNIHVFDAKSLYRKWTGGGHRIHATNSQDEVNHDITLLFGMDITTYRKRNPRKWDGSIQLKKDNLVGWNGWEHISQLFKVLNNTIPYVVLRNFEQLPEQIHMKGHGDVDLLVNDYKQVCLLANAKPLFKKPYRVHCLAQVGKKNVFFDFRYVGDDYYDEQWERSILENRQYNEKGFYVPDAENYFYSLLYHAAIHKFSISEDYIARLTRMAADLNINGINENTLRSKEKTGKILSAFLDSKGYQYKVAQDLTVHFNKSIAAHTWR